MEAFIFVIILMKLYYKFQSVKGRREDEVCSRGPESCEHVLKRQQRVLSNRSLRSQPGEAVKVVIAVG